MCGSTGDSGGADGPRPPETLMGHYRAERERLKRSATSCTMTTMRPAPAG